MAGETELERMVVRLVGDATDYQKMLKTSVASTKMAATQVEASGARIAAISMKLKTLGGSIRGIGMKLSMGITAPLMLLSGLATQASMKFETALSRIQGLVGLSAETVGGFREEILKLAPAVGKSPEELAEAMFFITSGGLRGADAMEALTISAKAASGGMGETKSVADAVTSAMNAYGKETLSATRATEILTAAVRAGKADAASFAPQFGALLPLAKSLGIGFDQVAGSLAFLTKTTGNASLAATGFKGVIRAINKPAMEVEKVLKEKGLSLEKLQKNFAAMSFDKAMLELKKALDSVDMPLKKFFTDSEGLVAALQMTGGASADMANVIDDVSNSVGIVDDAFKAWEETMGAGMAKQMVRTKAMLIEIGGILAPVMQQFLDFGEMAMGIWTNLSPAMKETAAKALAIAAALGPVLMYVGMMVAAVGMLIPILAALWSPVTLIVIGFGLLGAAIVKNTDWAGKAIDWLVAKFFQLRDWIMPAIQGVTDAIKTGDWELAFKIVMKQVQIAVMIPITHIRVAWAGMLMGMKQIWANTWYEIQSIFAKGSHKIAGGILWMQSKFDKSFKLEDAMVELEKEHNKAIKRMKVTRDKAFDDATSVMQSSVNTIQGELHALEAEQTVLVNKAAGAAKKAEDAAAAAKKAADDMEPLDIEPPTVIVPEVEIPDSAIPEIKAKGTATLRVNATGMEGVEAAVQLAEYRAGIAGKPKDGTGGAEDIARDFMPNMDLGLGPAVGDLERGRRQAMDRGVAGLDATLGLNQFANQSSTVSPEEMVQAEGVLNSLWEFGAGIGQAAGFGGDEFDLGMQPGPVNNFPEIGGRGGMEGINERLDELIALGIDQNAKPGLEEIEAAEI